MCLIADRIIHLNGSATLGLMHQSVVSLSVLPHNIFRSVCYEYWLILLADIGLLSVCRYLHM